MFLPASVCVSACLSVTTITKTIVDVFVPNFMGRSQGERKDQVRVSLRSVEVCGSNGKKTRRLLSRECVLSHSTFHLVLIF